MLLDKVNAVIGPLLYADKVKLTATLAAAPHCLNTTHCRQANETSHGTMKLEKIIWYGLIFAKKLQVVDQCTRYQICTNI